jgi:hypothetical protein
MKRLLAGVVTIVLMAVLLWNGARRDTSTPVDESSLVAARPSTIKPAETTVHALLASAKAGDVTTYLDTFTGPLKDRLSRQVAERGRAPFADDLRNASRSRKSHAVFAAEPDGPDAAMVTVEAVYPDRNERQTYRVEKTDAGWLVAGVETIKSHQPQSKYGAPVVYLAPEGPPVPMSVETGEEAEAEPK